MNANTTLRVSDFMSSNVMTVKENDLLYDAIRQMEIASLTALPVVDAAGKVCGILSNSDLLSQTYNLQCDIATLSHVPEGVRKTLTDVISEDNCDTKVSSVMNSDVETLLATETMIEAAESLIINGVHHLPVVDTNGRPVGIVSTTDIVRAVAFGAGK